MTIRHVRIRKVRQGDTLDSIVREYRLSSRRAILDIAENRGILEQLNREGDLPAGLHLHIPPNALELTTARLYKLHELRPVLLAHFDTQRRLARGRLRDAVLGAAEPLESDRTLRALDELQAFVARDIELLAANAVTLVELGVAISHTYVATPRDHAVRGSATDPMCSLYWLLTPAVLEQWLEGWSVSLWRDKWGARRGDEAWQMADRYGNAVSSIVVQQVDQRIREALALKQQLVSGPRP